MGCAPTKRVPLISWVQAGSWADVEDHYAPGEAEEWVEVYEVQPGEAAFALRVSGDSMTSPYPGDTTTFPDGTIIVVDPSRSAQAGDFVVAKDVVTQQATFKKLATDGGRWFLKPLNPTYPTVEIDDPAMRVIGKVIEFQFRRKL
jgi:SOS-response transcriptional repressor LexA